jgi:hypothetical protein
MASTSSLIVWQQSVADSLLAKLEAIDPHCIIAGGAPRDWYLGLQAKDLDVYLYVPQNSLLRHFKTQLAAIGITNIEQSALSVDDDRYISNPLVRWVFNYEESGEKVQLIVMKESTYTSVVQHFPLSICKVWYKGGKIIPYSRQFTETTDRKSIVKTGTEYSSDGWYIDKIRDKFPEFAYYESMMDFAVAHNLPTEIRQQAGSNYLYFPTLYMTGGAI